MGCHFADPSNAITALEDIALCFAIAPPVINHQSNSCAQVRESDEGPADTPIIPNHAGESCSASDLSLIAPDVQASPECMTKQEARAKWPTKPIYSHGSSRCWNDQPLTSRRPTTPPANISDSASKAHALDLSAPRPQATKTKIFLPSTMT